MIRILYSSFYSGQFIGCHNIIDEAYIISDDDTMVDWIKQFGGRMFYSEYVMDPDYIEFDNHEDAVVFKIRFGI